MVLCPAVASGQTASALDAKVQAPELAAPQRGSVTGQLASVTFGPATLSRGAFSLPASFGVPETRGKLLAEVFPTYGADSGLSEWGAGWHTSLAITRYRVLGDLDCATDELTGPFGRLVQGTDGYWYPLGLSKPIRVSWSGGDTVLAYLPDGTKMTFGGTGRTVNGAAAGATCTYAWQLAAVETVTGTKTRLDYIANASGRLFVSAASYGGQGDDFQYRVELGYEQLAIPFTDLRSGRPLVLDRRVASVAVLAMNAGTGVFEERWRYELGYEAEGLGPAFHLAEVQQVFRSGETPPATRYTYYLATEKLVSTELVENPRLSAIVAALGSDAIQPNRSGPVDLESDGLQDFEHSYDYRLIHQNEAGFTIEALDSAPNVNSWCRRTPGTLNTPRLIAQLRTGDDTQYVVDLRTDAYRTRTAFTVCNRLGQALGATQTLTGDWAPKANVRLVDLNRDHRPDLVRVQYGTYYVLPNISSETAFSFGPQKQGVLTPAFTPDTVWVHDFNGDGIADLVARYSTGIVVWFGKGNFDYQSPGQSFPLRSNGTIVTALSSLAFTFVDANKDGLTDILATKTSSNTTYLFVNKGTYLDELTVPALRSVDPYMSKPVIADLSGSGNTEIAYSKTSQGYAVALDGPETALMKSADDGKGTVLTFAYARAAPSPGVRSRNAVVSTLTIQSSGYDTASHEYAYADPKVHSTAKFLLGFDVVTRTDPLVVETAEFLNEDRYSGMLLGSQRHDANAPAVDAFEATTYVEVDPPFQGIPWKRVKEQSSGFVDQNGASISEKVEYLTYARDFCSETTRKTAAAGVLTATKSYVHPSAFGLALSCVLATDVEQGSHAEADSALNFRHELELTRNSVGLVEKVESVSPAGRWTLQTVGYRATDWLVEWVSSPGKGTTSFSYAPGTLLLRSVTAPDGVVVEALTRDPLHDGVLALKTTRGTVAYQQLFRFDGQERLSKQWDDLGAATEGNPTARYEYQFATGVQPGAIFSSQLIDATLASTRSAVDLVTAAGEEVVTASRIPEGWAFGPLVTRSRNTAETARHLRPTLAATLDPMALDHASLLSGANRIGSEVASIFGHAAETRRTYHAGVERQVSRSLSLASGFLKLTSTENGASTTTTWMDASKRVVAFDDEALVRYSYKYDALGRLCEVTLPDGKKHRARYDEHGRVWRVEREGIPGSAQVTVENVYDPVTGLASTKKFLRAASLPSSGTVVRTVGFAYDGIGRVSTETHADTVNGGTKTFRYFYDGATPSQPTLQTNLGLLTGVSGDGYAKTFDYRPDGLLTRRRVALPGMRTVETTLGYLESGTVGSRTVKVFDEIGSQLSASEQRYLYGVEGSPAYGRLEAITLNGSPFVQFGYGVNGEIRTASSEGGYQVELDWDSLTRRFVGSTQQTPQVTAGTTQRMNARGLVGVETFFAGAASVSRTYGYSAQRFLTSSSDASIAYGYGFDGFGLPTSITTAGVVKPIVRSGNTLTAGYVTYVFDALGRTVQRGDFVLTYGPDGQLATATRGGATWSFIHDEAGQRLLKLSGTVPVAAYLEEGYLDTTGLTERVQVAGRTVGLLKNGVFTSVPTDARGTVIAEANGAPRLASPFGWRSVHPTVSAAIDYVEKGFDADIELVRMGVRDYDSEINQFTTPDPLFLEDIEKLVASPVEGNLYGYVTNAPTTYVDPDGHCAVDSNRYASCSAPGREMIAGGIAQATQGIREGSAADAALGVATAAYGTVSAAAGTVLDLTFGYAWNAANKYGTGVDRLVQTGGMDSGPLLQGSLELLTLGAAGKMQGPTRPQVSSQAGEPSAGLAAGGGARGPGTTLDAATGQPVGRFVVDRKGNTMIEPVGGRTVSAGKGGVDTHTLYPNGSNYQRLNPQGHPGNPTPHGHGHLPGTGPGMKGQGPSIDPQGNIVPWNRADAHWPIQ
jgi:RHS repeat-associated protein